MGAVFFFFSSRRRHTRFKCDWSSDVCSSDLDCDAERGAAPHYAPPRAHGSWLDRRTTQHAAASESTENRALFSGVNRIAVAAKRKPAPRLRNRRGPPRNVSTSSSPFGRLL